MFKNKLCQKTTSVNSIYFAVKLEIIEHSCRLERKKCIDATIDSIVIITCGDLVKLVYIDRGRGGSMSRSLDLTTHTSLSPIQREFAPGFANYKKGCTRLGVASDKVYQLRQVFEQRA